MRSLLVAGVALALVPFAGPVWAASKTKPVSVTNFPATQNVGGTVSVSNLPVVQSVSGQVQVTNLPAVQNVDGEVEVTNLPAVQDVNVVGGCSEGTRQLLGFTTASVIPTGVLSLTLTCQAEFPGSRVCTTEEVLETTAVPENLTGQAWVVPTRAGDGSDVAGGSPENCVGWGGNPAASFGQTVNANGAFVQQICSASFPVACCGVAQ